ncbi:TetR/AcrR family transcriptional regulator [Sneathiella marina]|uniref:TetR/AcrR family transcriptional regulator n=1 Tax=Sneathiella marina TaxID=2950108 RepID=A0ABY4WA89_9PROT|nr:TetR/AcrR family transcriptional regulator [Sneathiella marina]USG63053.1 TetR/AcrR family transcriptional regulator [Sneathiella marina]
MSGPAGVVLATDRASKRKEEKRNRLLEAARKLFVSKGYHETRPQDIAREADVAHGTFYSHYTDKREIFLAFASSAQEDLHAFVQSKIPDVKSFEEYIRYSLTAIQEFAEQNPGLLRSAMVDTKVFDPTDSTSKEVRSKFASGFIIRLKNACDTGELYDDVDPDLIGHAMVGLIQFSAPHAYRKGQSRQEFVDHMTRFLTRALVKNPENMS